MCLPFCQAASFFLHVLAGPESVQTPREVYDQLKKEGYRVKYYRLPLTDGEAPKETIFDVFYEHVKDVHPSDALIFTCQMGGGRTTTGMVIGCLIRMHTSGLGILALLPIFPCPSPASGTDPWSTTRLFLLTADRSPVPYDYLTACFPPVVPPIPFSVSLPAPDQLTLKLVLSGN